MYENAHPSMALKLCKPYPFSAGYIEFDRDNYEVINYLF